MTGKLALLLMLAGSVTSGGCVAGMAASAVGAAVRSAQPEAQSNEALRPQAVQLCTVRAAQHGNVHIIDVEQRSASKMIVWGTATGAAGRQSFECSFTTKIVGFKLRPIKA